VKNRIMVLGVIFGQMIVAACLTVGCKDSYGTAAKLAQDVAVTIHNGATVVDQFRQDGTISVDEERELFDYFGTLNIVNGAYINCVQVAHKANTAAASFTACANSLSKAAGDPALLAGLHVTNAKAQVVVKGVAQGIATLAEATISALGGK